MTEIETAIRDEMRKALASLGAKPALLAEIDRAETLDAAALYDAAEHLGADRFLLAAIGSYGDTLSAKAVLRELRDWNAAPWETPPAHRRQRS